MNCFSFFKLQAFSPKTEHRHNRHDQQKRKEKEKKKKVDTMAFSTNIHKK